MAKSSGTSSLDSVKGLVSHDLTLVVFVPHGLMAQQSGLQTNGPYRGWVILDYLLLTTAPSQIPQDSASRHPISSAPGLVCSLAFLSQSAPSRWALRSDRPRS